MFLDFAGGVTAAGAHKLTKQDVVKDLRHLQQQVVLSYKAARKLRRTGSVNPALASAPTTPFGGKETPNEVTPLGSVAEDTEGGECIGEGMNNSLAGGVPETEGERENERKSPINEAVLEDGPVGDCVDAVKEEGAAGEQPGVISSWSEEGEPGTSGTQEPEGKEKTEEKDPDVVRRKQESRPDSGTKVPAASANSHVNGSVTHLASAVHGKEAGKEAVPTEHRGQAGTSGKEEPVGAPGKVTGADGRTTHAVNELSVTVHTDTSPIDPVAVLRASKAIHNTKKFIKSYHGERGEPRCQEPGQAPEFRLLFGVKLQDQGANPRAKCDPPPELLVLPPGATFKELKAEAGRAFQEMYVMMRSFRVTRVEGWGGTPDKAAVGPLLSKERNLGMEREEKAKSRGSALGAGKETVDLSGPSESAADVTMDEPGDSPRQEVMAEAGEGETGEPSSAPLEMGGELGTSAELEPGHSGRGANGLVNMARKASEEGAEPKSFLSPAAVRVAQAGRYPGQGKAEESPSSFGRAHQRTGKVHPLAPCQEGVVAASLWHLTGTGAGADLASEARFEAGLESWVVDCLCGTKDDDGERMAECDTCATWLHTRCLRIRDRDSVPAVVVCPRCAPGGQPRAKGKGPKKGAKVR